MNQLNEWVILNQRHPSGPWSRNSREGNRSWSPPRSLWLTLSLCLSFGGLSARRAATPVVSAHDGGGWSGSGTSPHQHNHEWHLQPRRDQWPVHLNGPVHPSLPHIDHRYVFRMSLAPLHTFTGFRVKGNAADNSANTHCGPSVKICQTHLKVKQA